MRNANRHHASFTSRCAHALKPFFQKVATSNSSTVNLAAAKARPQQMLRSTGSRLLCRIGVRPHQTPKPINFWTHVNAAYHAVWNSGTSQPPLWGPRRDPVPLCDMVARSRCGPDPQKRPPFGAERADPASPAGLSVGIWERNGTKTQSKRQFLHLAMAVRAKLEPRASEPTGASAGLSMARLERPSPPTGQKQRARTTKRTALRDPSAPPRSERPVSPAQNTDRVSSWSP